MRCNTGLGRLVAVVGAIGAILWAPHWPAGARDPAVAVGPHLVMIEEPGCSFCLRWERDVEPGYVRSEEGRIAPLVKRMRGDPSIADIPRVVYTPTFVLLRGGDEVGRIVGYAGADLFWWQLGELMRKLEPGSRDAREE